MRNHRNLSLFVFLITLLLSSSANADAEKRILVIQSYHPTLSWTRQCDEGIADTLGKQYKLEFYYLDSKRLSPLEIEEKSNEAYSYFKLYRPDLVMIGDDNALRLLGAKIVKTETPVVYLGINNNPRSYFKEIPENITGVLERTPVFPAARVLKSLLPATKRILLLFDDSPTTDSILSVTFKKNKSISIGGVLLEFKVASSWENWMRIISEAKEYDLIMVITFHTLKMKNGTHVDVTEVIDWTSAHSAVPVFSCQDYTVTKTGTGWRIHPLWLPSWTGRS